MHLPVVDFQSPTAAQDFCKSLHETGFGVLRNHPLEQSVVEGIYAEWLASALASGSITFPVSGKSLPADKLRKLAERLQLDEVVIITWTHDAAAQARSYELLAQEFSLTP